MWTRRLLGLTFKQDYCHLRPIVKYCSPQSQDDVQIILDFQWY